MGGKVDNLNKKINTQWHCFAFLILCGIQTIADNLIIIVLKSGTVWFILIALIYIEICLDKGCK